LYADVVEYYGENARTLAPPTFFSLFARFIKAFKVCDVVIVYSRHEVLEDLKSLRTAFIFHDSSGTKLAGLGLEI